MKIAKILATGATVLVLGGTAAGAALASGGTTAPAPAESISTVDTDHVQQGDQSTPDTSTTSEATSEKEATSETESDGPGGHADPTGNVNHEFDGAE